MNIQSEFIRAVVPKLREVRNRSYDHWSLIDGVRPGFWCYRAKRKAIRTFWREYWKAKENPGVIARAPGARTSKFEPRDLRTFK